MGQITRKRSGEIVKSTLRRSSQNFSAPSTPTKTVHFDNNLEQVRHFFQADQPISIGTESSLVNGEDIELEDPFRLNDSPRHSVKWEVNVTKFPKTSDGDRHLVQFESLHLSADCQSLIGTATVANIAFEKHVAARFTIDNWQTVSEVTAEYMQPQKPMDAHDQFRFVIELPDQADLQRKTVLLCIRYRVDGQEYWDNNSEKNYHVNFTRKAPSRGRRASSECDEATGYPSGPFSDRYNFTASLRAILTQHAIDERSCADFGTTFTLESPNRSRSDLNSTAYKDMIQNLCYFKSEDITEPLHEIPPLVYPRRYETNAESPSQVQFLLDQEISQVSRAISCF